MNGDNFLPIHLRHKSVLLGKDCEAILVLLELHAPAVNPRILDCTYNEGKMWKGIIEHQPHRMDINPEFPIDTVGDFTAMPFPNGSFDVIVFDPPHLPTNAASSGWSFSASRICWKAVSLSAIPCST